MKRRLITALIAGIIAAGVGVVVAFRMGQFDNMQWVGTATGLIGFLFGLVFKMRAI